jgi:hypothetical protein
MFKVYLTLMNLFVCLLICGYNSYRITELSNLKILNGGGVTWSINENCVGYPGTTNQSYNGRDILFALEKLFLNDIHNSKTVYGCFSPFQIKKPVDLSVDYIIPFIPYLFLTINLVFIWKQIIK